MKRCWGKLAIVAAAAGISTSSLAAPTTCTGKVTRIELERGHDDPPATLAPDSDRQGGRYQRWTGLRAARPNDRVTLTCFGPGKRVVRIALPAETDRCVWRNGRISCS